MCGTQTSTIVDPQTHRQTHACHVLNCVPVLYDRDLPAEVPQEPYAGPQHPDQGPALRRRVGPRAPSASVETIRQAPGGFRSAGPNSRGNLLSDEFGVVLGNAALVNWAVESGVSKVSCGRSQSGLGLVGP